MLGVWAAWGLLTASGPAPAPEVEPPSSAVASEAEPVREALRLVWEAGLRPVSVEDFMSALRVRLPPGRFAEATPDDEATDVWVVTVSQPRPGVFQLEIAPPGRQPAARRVDLGDADSTRRTLALLTLFALEHGEFPPLSEGVTEAEPSPSPEDRPRPSVREEPQPPDPVAEEPVPVVEPGTMVEPSDPSPPPRRLGGLVRLGAGPWLAVPTRHEAGATVPGLLVLVDAGLRLGSLGWVGIDGGWALHPSADVSAHRFAGGVFGGVRPRVRSVIVPARLGIDGGVLHGRGAGERVSRAFVAGTAAIGVEGAVRPDGSFHLGAELIAEFASRGSSFVTPVDAVGVGQLRGGVRLTVGWTEI